MKEFYPQELNFLLLYIKTIYKGLIFSKKGEVIFTLDSPKRTENICYKIYWNNKDEIFIIPYWVKLKDFYKIPYLFTNDPSGTLLKGE